MKISQIAPAAAPKPLDGVAGAFVRPLSIADLDRFDCLDLTGQGSPRERMVELALGMGEFLVDQSGAPFEDLGDAEQAAALDLDFVKTLLQRFLEHVRGGPEGNG